MPPHYDVFICHRGVDTKRNVVSVLNGMLFSRGITCFVDYEMNEGAELQYEIKEAIKSSRVHIVFFSPNFETSEWCLNEVFEIMKLQDSTGTSDRPRKVIPISFDVERSEVLQRAKDSEYNLKRSSIADNQRWVKAIKGLCDFQWFTYDSKTMWQWEELSRIAMEAEVFLKGVSSGSILHHQPQVHQTRAPASDYDVFVCHMGLDTKRNVVSVLRGMLHCKDITCFVDEEMDDGDAIKPHIGDAILKSNAYVILLSPMFGSSKSCLEQVQQIMSIRSALRTSNINRAVLPIFYDVEPSTVRYQLSTYKLANVLGSTDEERSRWSEALKKLSYIKGFEFKSESMFQWEELEKVVKKVRTSLKTSTRGNLYAEKICEVEKVLESKKSEESFVIGICGPNKSQFLELLVEESFNKFDALCMLSNLIEKPSKEDRLSHVIRKLYLDLITSPDEELPKYDELIRESRVEKLLQRKKCLVIIDVVGNDIQQTREVLELLKSKLSNSSAVVITSEFKHMLMEVVKVDKLIELPSLQESKGTLIICYREIDNVHESFLKHLQETFCMCGLEVRLLSKEQALSDNESIRNAKMILCIVSRSFSVGDFEIMLTDAAVHCPKVLYILYGSHEINERTLKPCFRIEVNFEKSQFNKREFKLMVNEVLHIFGKGNEKGMHVIDFPVGLVERVDEMKSRILAHLRRTSETSLQCFGIVGMGGAGKTTIARSIYNGMHKEFEKSCFCLNTRANVAATRSGLVDIQKKIFFEVFGKHRNKDEFINEIKSEEDGKGVLLDKLKGINALIVLDDVDSEQQLKALYDPLCCSLGPKSVVIMTTRYLEVLKSAQPTEIFHIQGLGNREHWERLFYWHAFLKPEPPAHLKEVSRKVIDACQGSPLSLEVMGAHLYGHDEKRHWDERLRSLQQNGEGIFSVLSLSLMGLDNNQREAFLDICCFLIGEKEEIACKVLESCYGYGRTYLDVLKSRCLITIDVEKTDNYYWYIEWYTKVGKERKIIGMHDHLRDMGRDIIRREERNRVWDEESAEDILKDEKALSILRGISIRNDFPFSKTVTKCRSLPALKILKVVEQRLFYDRTIWTILFKNNFLENVRCDDLRWLDWRNAQFLRLPRGLCSKSLRVLDLSKSAIRKRSLPINSLPNLQILDLPGCLRLTHLPKKIARLPSLEQLNLRYCRCLKTLSSLPTTLRHLELDGCWSLESLEAFLPNLQQLEAVECPKLKRLDLHASSMRSLKLLGCEEVEELDCNGLPYLERLSLRSCRYLRTLSSLPTTLQQLNLNGCERLESLEAFLPNIQEVEALCCYKLKRVDIHAPFMRSLDLSNRNLIEHLDCKGLPSLERLNLRHCRSLRTLSSLPTTLHHLELDGCRSLESLEAFLPNLQQLEAVECRTLKRVDLHAPCMRSLKLSGCEKVEKFDCKGLSSLESLSLSDCTSLKKLSLFSTSLKSIDLDGCTNVEVVDGIETLNNLRSLNVRGCPFFDENSQQNTRSN